MNDQIFQLTRESAPQAECHLAVEARLKEISQLLCQPDTVCIFILGLLLQGIEAKESPIFIFPQANFEEAMALILSWVENEQNKHYLLPPLVIHYAWAVSANLDEIMQSPDRFGEDACLVQTKIEWWHQQTQES